MSVGHIQSGRGVSFETAEPLPPVPATEHSSVLINQTLNLQPHLFYIVTPINIDKFEALLSSHPNQPLVNSVCRGLREGFWPYASINPDHPVTNDSICRELDDSAAESICTQRDIEITEERFSASFGTDPLPGMYSPPIHAVPKLHSDKLHLINDHSAGPFALNSWI
ncbi:hypothetical protein K439DRAFT_1648342 [Ramaria rubella]|nr:hypothetical protein K439DRAFT_1648342 [Ramaria rubella]